MMCTAVDICSSASGRLGVWSGVAHCSVADSRGVVRQKRTFGVKHGRINMRSAFCPQDDPQSGACIGTQSHASSLMASICLPALSFILVRGGGILREAREINAHLIHVQFRGARTAGCTFSTRQACEMMA